MTCQPPHPLDRRPEAVYAPDLREEDLDESLLEAISSLAGSGVQIALAGLHDAETVVQRFDPTCADEIVVADAVRAFAPGPRISGTKLREGPSDTFSHWLMDRLWKRGIGPMLVLVATRADGGAPPLPRGTDFDHAMWVRLGEGGGLTDLLRQLVESRRQGELPDVDESPGWLVTVDGDHDGDLARVKASLLALSNGTIGLRGDLEDRGGDDHFILVSGAYGQGPDGLVRPLLAPAVTVLDDSGSGAARPVRALDLRTGVVARRGGDGGLRAVRFVSLARPGVLALRGEDGRVEATWTAPLGMPSATTGLAGRHRYEFETDGGIALATTSSDRAAAVTAARQRAWSLPECRRVERIAATATDAVPARDRARSELTLACDAGFDRLLAEHRRAWARRWDDADIEITGDPDAQLAIRHALFHLLSCAPTAGEAPVGARGLTGLAYAGHVFWDTDVYVLPTLAATLPDAALAVLAYRTNRLPAARAAAAARGLPGARFSWESADTGSDVTPRSTRDAEGQVVPIRTGEHAEHINADIAWAVRQYLDWTGDDSVLQGDGRALVTETARYWRALVRPDVQGRGHLYGVIGPDEYHEVVDDNAYTNNVARWHLRWAARLARDGNDAAEATALEQVAASLVDSFDPASGRHEQFAGFWQLEPVVVSEIARPPVAADLLLGRNRIRQTQIIKQPDVLMLHHLLPEECPPGSLAPDLAYYLPRTAHGSSLSPAICASLIARDGRPDDAMELCDIAARLDFDDLTATTAGGLHLATMGGLWQATVFGFAGIRPTTAGLAIDPQLPRRWERLSVRIRYHDVPVRITIDHETIDVETGSPVAVIIEGEAMRAPARVARIEQRRDP